VPLGAEGELGFLAIAVATDRVPGEIERMLLDVAATKIANLLLRARHASDSRLLQEQTAQYKEELLHQLVHSIAAEVTLSTPDGEIVFVNRTCMEHIGLPVGAHL